MDKTLFALLASILLASVLMAGCAAATPAPSEAPPEIVVAEGEANCPIVDSTYEEGIMVSDPELGDMERGALVSWRNDCSEPYEAGKCYGIQDFYSPSEDTVNSNAVYECITDEGGVWVCTSEVKPPVSLSKCNGEGKYKGLQISEEYNFETSIVKYRVTKLAE